MHWPSFISEGELMKTFMTVITAIIGIAILAVLVGGGSNTSELIKALTGGFSKLIETALSASK